MTTSARFLQTLKYVIITVLTCAVFQAVVVIMHEFTHSTMAWMLGHMRSPLDIVWGNPLTLTGWDEGVEYSQLYISGHFHAAAVIGFCPMILHAVIVTLGIVLLQREWMKGKKWLFHFLFWFVIINFMELIAYITMRSFWDGGDVYHLNHGLGLSPWVPFIIGSLAIAAGLYFLFHDILPRMYAIFALENRLNQWTILLMVLIILFMWGSGLRVSLATYPNQQWMFGLLSFAAFIIILVTCNPSRAWVISRVKIV